jgi:amino acid transporter
MAKRPLYLATCIYGIPFIFLGTAAGNAIVFAENIVLASGNEVENGPVRGIAVGVITFACLLHAMSRTGGIWLNNFFGSVKFLMLFALFVMGVAYAAGRFGGSNATAAENLNIHKSFAGAATSSYGYAEAFLAIIFAVGGFNQGNYVSVSRMRAQLRC